MTWCNINMSGSNLCFSLSNVNTPNDLRNCILNTFLNMLFTFKVTSSDHLATLSFFFNCYNIFKLNSTDVSNLHIKIIFSSVHVFCIRCRRLSTAKWHVFWEEQSTFTFLEQWGLTWNGRNTAWSPCCASLSVVNLRNYHWREDTRTTIIWKDEESVGQNWKAVIRQQSLDEHKTWYATSGESQSNISTFCADEDFGERLDYCEIWKVVFTLGFILEERESPNQLSHDARAVLELWGYIHVNKISLHENWKRILKDPLWIRIRLLLRTQ